MQVWDHLKEKKHVNFKQNVVLCEKIVRSDWLNNLTNKAFRLSTTSTLWSYSRITEEPWHLTSQVLAQFLIFTFHRNQNNG